MSESESKILRVHYEERDFVSSPEGILKILAVVSCLLAGAGGLASEQGCSAAPSLAGGAGGGALGGGVLLALLVAAGLAGLPRRLPLGWLYTDIVVSSLIGLTVLVMAVLGAVYCGFNAVGHYVYFISSLVCAVLCIGSAVTGYTAAMGRVDRARPKRERRPTPTADVDV